MEKYTHGCATVRIHGVVQHERLKEAAEIFLKQVIAQRKEATESLKKGCA